MEYPAWFVAYLTAPMLIPLVAIPHVIVAQFAVGGGFLLADMVRRAYRDDLPEVLDYIRRITRFFILITVVFGAVTGFGIWWTIGLTSPQTTSVLINIFVFGWAAEWVAFALEIVSAFAFYYLWDRLSPREHMTMGWIYAISAWVSLVLITGITSFMLTTGSWGPDQGFFVAFFNPSFIPQMLARTGGSLVMAALWIGFLTSLQFIEAKPRDLVIRWTSQWALAGMVLILIGGVWYLAVMPEHAHLNLIRAPILLGMMMLNVAITVIVIAALGIGFFVGYRWITPPSALLLLLVGFAAVATGEFVREGARKPYLIENYVFSPGVRVEDVEHLKRTGFVANTPWLRSYLEETIQGFEASKIGQLPEHQKVAVGEGIFRYHCSSCHALVGYNGMIPIVRPWNDMMIRELVKVLHRANPAMPPWMGNEAEKDALTPYLIRLSNSGR
jgi:cytochrome bd-type quinol oxidase subunit 1